MARPSTRRGFLQSGLAGAALAGVGNLAFMGRLKPVSAEEAKLDPKVVALQPEIEPIVRLLEETPRERLLEEVAARIRTGLSYREVLAALLLAGVRNVQPRPEVGFKFHAVLVVNSAHLASLSSPDEHRWLPIFWALDHFKDSQAQDVREGNWTMSPVDESAVPDAEHVRAAFTEAMDRWDVSAADAAAAGVARHMTSQEAFELFCPYGARDFRSIGHKAIYVANAWRTLEHIGWQHAEPVLRSLAYAILKHDGTNPAEADLPADRPWRVNKQLVEGLGSDWQSGDPDGKVTTDLLGMLRQATPDEACREVAQLLESGAGAAAVWDAMFIGSGELLARQPGIVPLHAVTSTNALHYNFRATGDDQLKRMLLFQNVAFITMFREAMRGRGHVGETRLDQLEPASVEAQGDSAVEEIFADVSRDRNLAARKVLSYANNQSDPKPLVDAARLLVFLKGTNAHDYKFSSAVLEDYAHVSPDWRARYLASSVFNLRGSGDSDNRLVQRTRAALSG